MQTLEEFGQNNRRVAIVAVLAGASPDCLDSPTLAGWACVFMLHPINQGGSDRQMWIEYIGDTTDQGSPCATLGIPGGPGSSGPNVPTLVQ